jgi:GNAT superfamily N-acetyltransferase
MDSLCVTAATPADLPRLAALLAGPDAAATALTTAMRGLRHALEHAERGGVWVLRNKDAILGLVSLFETISTAEGGPVALLQDLVVSPEHRRRGYGNLLLDTAIGNARARGLRRITLVADSLSPEARRFFQKHGAADSGMRPLRLTFTA